MRYPNGEEFEETKDIKKNEVNIKASLSSANRGMVFETEINITNEYYLDHGICLITKRPTPINVVKVDYSKNALITHAYFEKQSTTDYNGVFKSRYIDFEAKSTKIATSFPLKNITPHQINHLKNVKIHGGIAFFLVNFEALDEVYLIDCEDVIYFFENSNRKSIPLEVFKEKGILIEKGLGARIDYIKAVIAKYFS